MFVFLIVVVVLEQGVWRWVSWVEGGCVEDQMMFDFVLLMKLIMVILVVELDVFGVLFLCMLICEFWFEVLIVVVVGDFFWYCFGLIFWLLLYLGGLGSDVFVFCGCVV